MIGNRGFSLVEAVVATTIFCVCSAVSYPCLVSMKAGSMMRTVVEQVYVDLQAAKITAIKANSYTVVKFRPDGYTIFVDDGAGGSASPGDWICQDEETVIAERSLPTGVVLENRFHNDALRFRGVAGISAGSIKINGPNNISYKIILSIAGRLRVEKV